MVKEDIERNFGFLVHDVARLLRTAFDRRMKEVGLTRSQWWVLNNLFQHNGVNQAELAQFLEVERPTLGRLIDRLENKGWVKRVADANDRRAKRIFLTEEVAPTIRTMRKIARETRSDALTEIPKRDREELVNILIKIKKNLLKPESTEATE
tara:strand:- start:16 stop:471 length:456 start_codon:yes stop_codon:yes gene_type:complete